MAGKTHMIRVGDEAAELLFNARLGLEAAAGRRCSMNELIVKVFKEVDWRHVLEAAGDPRPEGEVVQAEGAPYTDIG